MMRVRTTSTGSVQAVESAEAMKPSAAELLMSRWRRPASSAVNWTTATATSKASVAPKPV